MAKPQHIPQAFLDELLQHVDIVALIDKYVPLKKSGGDNYMACCPFHSEKTPSFSVSSRKQFYYCFGCGASGNAIRFLMENQRFEFVEAVRTLAADAGMTVPEIATYSKKEGGAHSMQQKMAQQLDTVAAFYQTQLREHDKASTSVAYLKGRGLSGEICQRYRLGYAPPGWRALSTALATKPDVREVLLAAGLLIEKQEQGAGQSAASRVYDRFRDRIMFPIRNPRGQVIAFGGRVIDEGTPKYLNSPESTLFHKREALYGLYEALQAQRKLTQLVVVEGYMDVIALAQQGITHAVATLGTAITEPHLKKCYRLVPEVVVCFDGDKAGEKAAWRALEVGLGFCQQGQQLKFMFLPAGDDPDSFVRREGKAAFLGQLAAAKPLSDFFFEQLIREVDTQHLEGRARLVTLAKPYLQKIPKGVFASMMWARLAELSGEDVSALGHEVASQSNKMFVKNSRQTRRRNVSSLQRALNLLLHYPEELAQQCTPELQTKVQNMAESNRKIKVLHQLIAMISTQPALSIAMILQRWSEKDERQWLAKLAAIDPVLLEKEAVAQEFTDLISRVLQEFDEQKRQQQLVDLGRKKLQDLSAEEKTTLLELLQKTSK